MKLFWAIVIIIAGVCSYFIYENNFDTQNICLSSSKKNIRQELEKNPDSTMKYLEKWYGACGTELVKKKHVSMEKEKNRGCIVVESATRSALVYASALRFTNNVSRAEETLTQTMTNLEPYAKCVQHNVFDNMLAVSLNKIR